MNLRHNLGLKAVSLGLALVAWALVQGERTYTRTVRAQAEYLLPEDLVPMMDDPAPTHIVLTVEGTRAALGRIQESEVIYTIDLAESGVGRTVHNLLAPPAGLPEGVTIQTTSPASIEFRFDSRTIRSVPVQLRTSGTLAEGYVETGRVLLPDTVKLVGSRKELEHLDYVRTRTLNLARLHDNFDQLLPLDLAGLHLDGDNPHTVRVRLGIDEEVGERKFELGVQRPEAWDAYHLEPAQATVVMHGPVPVLIEAASSEHIALVLGGVPPLDPQTVVRYSASGQGEAPAVTLQIDHPRSAEISALRVIPQRFVLRREEGPGDSAGDPTEGAAPDAPEGANTDAPEGRRTDATPTDPRQ